MAKRTPTGSAGRTLAWLALSALLIGTNWSLYVFATTHHATLEASLGYYINPLVNVVLGVLFLGERLNAKARRAQTGRQGRSGDRRYSFAPP